LGLAVVFHLIIDKIDVLSYIFVCFWQKCLWSIWKWQYFWRNTCNEWSALLNGIRWCSNILLRYCHSTKPIQIVLYGSFSWRHALQ